MYGVGGDREVEVVVSCPLSVVRSGASFRVFWLVPRLADARVSRVSARPRQLHCTTGPRLDPLSESKGSAVRYVSDHARSALGFPEPIELLRPPARPAPYRIGSNTFAHRSIPPNIPVAAFVNISFGVKTPSSPMNFAKKGIGTSPATVS